MQSSWQPASFVEPLRLFNTRRLKMSATPIRGGQRNAQPEFGSTVFSRLYFYTTMMQLQNAVGHCQANAAASRLGGEVQIENAVADFVRNAHFLIGDADDRCLPIDLQAHFQLAAFRHRLGSV